MEDVWIYLVTFFASLLTLITGFGLGTILTPVFALFYDIRLAILLVAIVHLLNGILKFILFRRYLDLSIIRRFGILSIVGALTGSLLQLYVYAGFLKAFLGVVLVGLGLMELFPKQISFRLPRKIDLIGGLLSGLLGGLVGNQGAIRSAYLLNYNISKESFIATATAIALSIDLVRIPVYLTSERQFISEMTWALAPVVVLAFVGTIIGKGALQHLSLPIFKKIIAFFVVLMGLLFVSGML